MAWQPVPSSWLSASDEVIPVLAPLPVDAGLAARGREYFGKFGCASCHDDLGVSSLPAPALAGLDASRGCLSQERGPWPAFDLDDSQRELVARALPEQARTSMLYFRDVRLQLAPLANTAEYAVGDWVLVEPQT